MAYMRRHNLIPGCKLIKFKFQAHSITWEDILLTFPWECKRFNYESLTLHMYNVGHYAERARTPPAKALTTAGIVCSTAAPSYECHSAYAIIMRCVAKALCSLLMGPGLGWLVPAVRIVISYSVLIVRYHISNDFHINKVCSCFDNLQWIRFTSTPLCTSLVVPYSWTLQRSQARLLLRIGRTSNGKRHILIVALELCEHGMRLTVSVCVRFSPHFGGRHFYYSSSLHF